LRVRLGDPVDRLADDVGVAGVTGGLLDHVQQDPAQAPLSGIRMAAGSIRRGHLLGYRPRLGHRRLVAVEQRVDGVIIIDAILRLPVLDGPDARQVTSGYDRLEPAALDVAKVFDDPQE
jgi:hypothetical protein